MRSYVAIFALAVFVVTAQGFPPIIDELRDLNERIAELRRQRIPQIHEHHRQARDVNVDPRTGTVSGDYPVGDGKVFGTIQGADGKFGYKTNVFDNEHGKLDASAYHSRSLGPAPASSAGGRLDWQDNFGAASLDLSRSRGANSVNAAGGGNWPIAKDWTVGAQGTYSQTFGRGRPDFGMMGTINGRW